MDQNLTTTLASVPMGKIASASKCQSVILKFISNVSFHGPFLHLCNPLTMNNISAVHILYELQQPDMCQFLDSASGITRYM